MVYPILNPGTKKRLEGGFGNMAVAAAPQGRLRSAAARFFDYGSNCGQVLKSSSSSFSSRSINPGTHYGDSLEKLLS
ncbi:unnamed protein product, partial [Mesorhabditis belari]|uniref:Uncharacterized protein n=1 Tax=Mesorhabditis belari TaxID=2138241 RepID=A0AAF3J6B2_9BILA